MKYFAYGSNMSINRMIERGIIFNNLQKASLDGYEFIINKKSKKDNNIGFANIKENKNSIVEGILYDIEDFIKLDKFEGYPIHYNKKEILVNTEYGTENAITYIANENWIGENLKVTEEYKNYIILGKEYLSEKYFNFILIQSQICLPITLQENLLPQLESNQSLLLQRQT